MIGEINLLNIWLVKINCLICGWRKIKLTMKII